MSSVAIIIPAKNEFDSLKKLIPKLISSFNEYEIIVVNDGSTDKTSELLRELDIKSIEHKYSKGNGAAIKAGARAANAEALLFMDADGQHQVNDIKGLVEEFKQGYDMVVGQRNRTGQASFFRYFANSFYNWLSSKVVGHDVKDLTSGFRVVDAKKFKRFLYLLPNGFSYPTTITMAFFRSGYSVNYYPITVKDRIGKSHINLIKDGFRFIIIIFKIGTLYSPLKLFTPISVTLFLLGIVNYIYTLLDSGRFTNMSATLLVSSIIVFLIGLVSEQINSIQFENKEED
ncbi:glycosyltransferase family 2 protein [Pleionea mediterranea]|uniref:Glycosyltransferase involved in cell wall biosynthesis n=1 Tax=Pleionea mediterranea TaxID=523701 RepID=A0A316G0M6_9GAMM|nr:glycosyltransferase family 2 protein [Pleionea mediterranea]PWK54399.1 glycosyltransferase involved in cell wall biosynthesis [Pleionea mediterranea]